MALSKSHLPCLVLVEPRKRWTEATWTDCDKAGDYAVPNVLSPRDLVFRPDNMDETIPHMQKYIQDLHNILHTLNHTMHSTFPCEHKLRQHELSFKFSIVFHVFEISLMENKCLNTG